MESSPATSKLGWLWPLAIAVLIFAASSRPRLAGGAPIPHFDKVVHFSIYGLLATLVCRQGRGWRSAALSVIAVSLYGATDEWHQSYVPGRSTELADWVADTAGAALAVVLYVKWDRYRKSLEETVWVPRRAKDRSVDPGVSPPCAMPKLSNFVPPMIQRALSRARLGLGPATENRTERRSAVSVRTQGRSYRSLGRYG